MVRVSEGLSKNTMPLFLDKNVLEKCSMLNVKLHSEVERGQRLWVSNLKENSQNYNMPLITV